MDFESIKVVELKNIARYIGLVGFSTMRKSELISALSSKNCYHRCITMQPSAQVKKDVETALLIKSRIVGDVSKLYQRTGGIVYFDDETS